MQMFNSYNVDHLHHLCFIALANKDKTQAEVGKAMSLAGY